MMNNIMLDLEALDSNSSGVLVSIGAVYFDIQSGALGEEFYAEISIEGMKEQLKKGRTVSLDTLQWWMQQSDSARSVFNSKTAIGTLEALVKFKEYAIKYNNVRMWGNGADFDNVFLKSVYQSYGLNCPWSFRYNRCYRTVKALLGNKAKVTREGTHHNGLDDAKTQALHLLKMLNAKGVLQS